MDTCIENFGAKLRECVDIIVGLEKHCFNIKSIIDLFRRKIYLKDLQDLGGVQVFINIIESTFGYRISNNNQSPIYQCFNCIKEVAPDITTIITENNEVIPMSTAKAIERYKNYMINNNKMYDVNNCGCAEIMYIRIIAEAR